LICSNFPLFISLRQKQLNVSLIDFFLFLFFFFYATDIFWIVTKWNNYFFVFWYATKSRRRRNWIPRNFCGINKKQKFQKDITWLMKPSSDTKWCEPRDHTTHNQDWDLIPESRNRSDRSVTQWKPAPRHQHYWIE